MFLNMKKGQQIFVLILFALVVFTTDSRAQIPASKEFNPKIFDPYYTRPCKSFFLSLPVRDADVINGVKASLQEINGDLKATSASLQLQHDITSQGGRHFTFEQTYNGIPIFHSQIKVNLDKENRIESVFHGMSPAGIKLH